LGVLACCGNPVQAQIAKVVDDSGRRFFINAEPPVRPSWAGKVAAAIYMPAETSFTGADARRSASTATGPKSW